MTDVTKKLSSICSFGCEKSNPSITGVLLADADASYKKGYYDAEKCRNHIANQSRVSKIDRFATQINNAQEIESEIHDRITKIINSYQKQISSSVKDFMSSCKYTLDDKCSRSSNYRKSTQKNRSGRPKKRITTIMKKDKINDDLLKPNNLRMIMGLMGKNIDLVTHEDQDYQVGYDVSHDSELNGFIETQESAFEDEMTEEDFNIINDFDPSMFVNRIKDFLTNDRRKSEKIRTNLRNIKQIFEQLATEHRLNVDLVYAAEEERQSASCVRRSAYNLSIAAIKATSTPVHVKSVTEF